MGIPKFYRYIAQRWPLTSQLVNDNVIPEFDNLYLDMNSIVHMSTHANAERVGHLDEQMCFVQIGNYIEHLFTIIKPQRHLFMAIDGVAPRAKMNQQRSRRFRSAQEAEEAQQKCLAQGLELEEDPFDSNCITPGTVFMANLSVFLRDFIVRKMSTDTQWKQCKIVLSGHEVPGEGEHKIMQFIRQLRAQPDYDVNTRHCLYGLDADLIMLGLSTHEQHFSLLREEVLFGPKRNESKELSAQRFNLLHLSLVRAYMQLELRDEKNLDVDFERVLDDLILAMFFLGNDFLPVTPMLMIEEDAIPVIFETYKKYMREHKNAYLSCNGEIFFLNLKNWLKLIMGVQIDKFEEVSLDPMWLNDQLSRITGASETQHELTLSAEEKQFFNDEIRPYMLRSLRKQDYTPLPVHDHGKLVKQIASASKFVFEDGELRLTPDTPEEDARRAVRLYSAAYTPPSDADHAEYAEKFNHWRNRYYMRKFHDTFESETVHNVAVSYLTGLQWVLFYYYRGCPSWSWFYPYHYAPMTPELISAIGDGFAPQFTLGVPFTPFEQLMSVLPDRSSALLPPCLRPLVLDETSPIHDFYPHDFKLDRNNKKALWEAVVLIPFIDGDRLLATVRPIEETQLSPDEVVRNSFGPELRFEYNEDVTYFYQSPRGQDVPECHTVIFPSPVVSLPFRYGMLPNALKGKSALYGFPALDTLGFKHTLERGYGVKIFERPSMGTSVILHIAPSSLKLKRGERVHVRWPFLIEAQVESVEPVEKVNPKVLNAVVQGLGGDYKRLGIDIGKTKELVFVHELVGLRRLPDGSLRKEFAPNTQAFPLQLIVKHVVNSDSRFAESHALPIELELPAGSYALLLLAKFYGLPAKILNLGPSSATVEAYVPDADVLVERARDIAVEDTRSEQWFSMDEACAQLKAGFRQVSALTSRLMVRGDRDINVAFPVCTFRSDLRAEGYSRLGRDGRWELSKRCLEVLLLYARKFPQQLAALKKDGKVNVDDAVKMRQWVKEHMEDISFVPLNSMQMTARSVKNVEQAIVDAHAKQLHVKKVEIKNVERGALLSPATAHHQLRTQQFRLGARVVSTQTAGKVDLFARGVVVGIVYQHKSTLVKSLDVVWDQEFAAGSTLDGRCDSKRGLTVSADSVLNVSSLQLAYSHRVQPDFTSAKVDTRKSAPGSRKQANAGPGLVPAQKRDDWQKFPDMLKDMFLEDKRRSEPAKGAHADANSTHGKQVGPRKSAKPDSADSVSRHNADGGEGSSPGADAAKSQHARRARRPNPRTKKAPKSSSPN